ncbi:membrane frizzled-related protein-like [Ylistrum balloti]|uniref:membrane frizzled-related protein-like n=1 Tax=Ylistrum balloti TaxID=509963 RepID=UPI0029059276|nr:membrane frizzled-related protein-like [Ylistrum balloti]
MTVTFLVRLAWIVWSFGLVAGHKHAKHWKSEFLEDHCSRKIKLHLFQRFELTRDLFYKHGWHCDVTLEAPAHHVVAIAFQKFDIGRSKSVVCEDALRIYDGDSIRSSTNKGLCGQMIPQHVMSSSNTLTLKFKSRYITTGAGFTIDVTTLGVAENDSDSNPDSSSCPDNSFRCMETFCLDRTLVCDGVPNCRDKSDESANSAGCAGLGASWIDLSVGARVAIFFVVSFLLIGMCVMIIYCLCCPASAKPVAAYLSYKKI